MGATDNLLAGASGVFDSANAIGQKLIDYKLRRQNKAQDYLDELDQYRAKQPIDIATKKAESGIAIDQAGAEALAKVPALTQVEVQKDRQLGKDFTPSAQQALGLDPNKSYRISEAIATLNAIDKKTAHAETMAQQQKLLDERLTQRDQMNELNQTNKKRLAYENYKGNHFITSHLPWSPDAKDFGVAETSDTPTVNKRSLDSFYR